MRQMRIVTLHLLLLWSSMNLYTLAYPSHNYEILKAECIERTQRDFNNNIGKRKETKIIVNGKQLGYYGFENSANAVILLDVSNTNVQLPKMNISFTNLIMLHASYNGLEKIDDIGNETFPSLKFLNLSHNAISNIKSHLFNHLSEIEILDLSHNCFVHFNYDHVFLKHENLKKIYLHDNLLHKIHGTTGLNNHLMHLELMDLSRNYIEDFNDLNIEIKELKLTNNSLKSLNIHHADEMKLYARHNQITSFSTNGNFKFLDLSHNEFKYLSQIEVTDAKVLQLSYNQIEGLAMTESSEYTESSDDVTSYEEDDDGQKSDEVGINVEILDLSYNKLENINSLKFFQKAIKINLESNNFKNIELENIRKKFQRLTYISFINNPLTSVDLDEMRFHNDTRFLNMQIDFIATTTSPSSTFLPLLIPTTQTPTTESQLNTTQSTTTTSTACSEHNNIIMLKGENTVTANKIEWHNRQEYWIWIFGIFVIAGFIVSIIYNKQQNKTQMRYMNREFNEAENFF
ncbi:toll-like receptor 3 [Chironomus tepperi]|uniref:toll-like receptor 3 n=1 Tax=Chironomus tepperi TaxID=113505 RepID=UPI00391F71D8